ncbi:MAG TPA: hypothetical protein VK927_09145 [Adhaeribacter sp.]|nr:hypothetical protein [Adhaeribacter sp.]
MLNFNDKKKSKELQLFQDILDGTAVAESKKKADNAEGRMVRVRLRKKLLNHLFFLDFTDAYIKVSHRYEQNSLDLLHQARILIKESEYQISEKLLRSALKIAKDAEFTSIVLTCIEQLRGIYVQTGNTLQFQKVSRLLEHYRSLHQKEQEAESLYYMARLEINRSVNAKKSFLPKLEKMVAQLKALWKEDRSFYLFELYYKTNIWYQELTNNFTNIVQITSETEQLLASGKINSKRFDDRYNKYVKVYAHLRARQFTEGLAFAEMYAQSFNRASNNWFAFMENYFLLAMHARRYEIATNIIKEINLNPFFPKITKIARERWELYRSYLYFINPSQDLLRQFNYQAFMAATPEYSKDKQGFNVAILILQFLHFLKAKEVEPLLYRIENLKKYSGRHFKDNFSIRSQLFFKLLMLAVREDLKPDACRRKGRALADKLAATPAPGDAYAEIEIIPYEQLWEQILEMLRKL